MADDQRLLEEGQIVRGTWTVDRFLGEGAFGEVYRVKHRILGRQAMKILKVVGMTVEETEQELHEAILLSRIDHPNIIRIFEANTTETSIGVCGFFTMQLVAGGSLEQFWSSHQGKLVPMSTAVDIALQVARGLAVAHQENPPIVHRDIKPQNILIGYETTGLRARISDFGLAKQVNPLSLRASARGTLAFKAPEAFLEDQGDSCASDVWALGATFYLLLTDRLPYPNIQEVVRGGLPAFGNFIPPSQLNSTIDKSLDRVLSRCLAVRKEDRYPSAIELMRDLEAWRPKESSGEMMRSDFGKRVLGNQVSGGDKPKAEKLAAQAIALVRTLSGRPDAAERLKEAADLMEEAINHWPEFREKYEHKLKAWRKGCIM